MKDTRKRLCLAAISLFNEKGYDNTSLREIAEAAGTTIGNLTYHFPHKEDLIAEIQNALHLDFFHLFPGGEKGDWIKALVHSFKQAEINQSENSFYYKSYIKLSFDSCAIRENNHSFREQLYRQYCECFVSLKLQGKVRKDLPDQEYESLAYILICIIPLWNQMQSVYQDTILPHNSLSERLCRIVVPYISRDGWEEYARLCLEICGVTL